jgi:hypothetical protein
MGSYATARRGLSIHTKKLEGLIIPGIFCFIKAMSEPMNFTGVLFLIVGATGRKATSRWFG